MSKKADASAHKSASAFASAAPRRATAQRFRLALARWIAGRDLLASVSVQVDDSAGWYAFHGGPNDRDHSEIQQQYSDALEAWRKNPMAKRIVDIITDYCLGDGMTPTAPGRMGGFIQRWWHHPKNQMPLRLSELCAELSRAGDLFLTLHRNPEDGMSYLRPIPKDRIIQIDTLANDWETEIAYHEAQDAGEARVWLSPAHPNAAEKDAVMVHYAVNRVVGCLMGESDLGTIIPWLLRYSRLVEDRVRLHWAARAFLWIVQVPSNKVAAKREQYRTPPDSGSIIVKDENETWSAVSPDLKGFDAQFDTRAVRQMIDAGSGLPPHWRGEAHDVSLATAEAMEHAASRHLRRRQLYIIYLVTDLAHTCYVRAAQIGKASSKPDRAKISIEVTDIDRDDNRDLAAAARTMAHAMTEVQNAVRPEPGRSETLRRMTLRMVMKFAGEPIEPNVVNQVFAELGEEPVESGG
jgi:hypothetical protein